MKETYTIEIHRHNFAAWAAARAAQRSFTNVDNLKNALEQCGVREFVLNTASKNTTAEQYKALHSEWCNGIIGYLDSIGIDNASFGRAAKLVAIYVKAMVVVCDSDCELSKVAYPPIDGLILKSISKDRALPKELRQKCTKMKWTQLDEKSYDELIFDLKKYVISDQPMWILERYWSVVQSS